MLCCFAAEIEITSVTVSSTLASQSNLYEANHLIDELKNLGLKVKMDQVLEL